MQSHSTVNLITSIHCDRGVTIGARKARLGAATVVLAAIACLTQTSAVQAGKSSGPSTPHGRVSKPIPATTQMPGKASVTGKTAHTGVLNKPPRRQISVAPQKLPASKSPGVSGPSATLVKPLPSATRDLSRPRPATVKVPPREKISEALPELGNPIPATSPRYDKRPHVRRQRYFIRRLQHQSRRGGLRLTPAQQLVFDRWHGRLDQLMQLRDDYWKIQQDAAREGLKPGEMGYDMAARMEEIENMERELGLRHWLLNGENDSKSARLVAELYDSNEPPDNNDGGNGSLYTPASDPFAEMLIDRVNYNAQRRPHNGQSSGNSNSGSGSGGGSGNHNSGGGNHRDGGQHGRPEKGGTNEDPPETDDNPGDGSGGGGSPHQGQPAGGLQSAEDVADNGEEDQSLPNDPSTGHGGQGGQGGDIGNLKLPRGARDNRGGLDRTVNPGVRLVGTKTGAGDEEEANVGTPSQTATGRDADPGSPGNVDDVGGHRGLRSGAGGAQVTGFAARIWWLLWGERGQPREIE